MADPAQGNGQATSMVDSVYATLLDAIVQARLGAGTLLSQNKLATRMGVSRTPVREALLRLERDGLVKRLPDSGFAVASITASEVHEACDLLDLLDTYVYLRASDNLSPSQRSDLLELAQRLVDSAESGATEQWRAADERYHEMVMAAAGNRFVTQYLQQTRRRVQRFWLQKPHFEGGLRTCSQDHVALAKAVVDTDAKMISDTVHAHIERLRTNVLARLENAGPLLPDQDPLAAFPPRDAVTETTGTD